MRLALVLITAACACAQNSIVLQPAVITSCTPNGLGNAVVAWRATTSPVTVRVGNSALTGASPARGTAATGDWVTDGMVFILVDAAGKELARTSAQVKCNAIVADFPPTASYFPLQVGNEWIYVYNSRISSSTYLTRRITRAEVIGDVVWYVMAESFSGSDPITETRYRMGDGGRIYTLTTKGEQLYLDPSPSPDPNVLIPITSRDFTAITPAGVFPGALSYSIYSSLDLETGTFARGIGFLMNNHNMLTGSSGGFTQGLTLVSARIGGSIVFGPPSASIQLSAEATTFDVTNRTAPNCAVPCYFVACGLVPGADPPGTYKPCFRAQVRMEQAAPPIDLFLLSPSNLTLYHATLKDASAANQVQLYIAPNQPFPPGNYKLQAQTPDGRIAILPIQLK